MHILQIITRAGVQITQIVADQIDYEFLTNAGIRMVTGPHPAIHYYSILHCGNRYSPFRSCRSAPWKLAHMTQTRENDVCDLSSVQ